MLVDEDMDSAGDGARPVKDGVGLGGGLIEFLLTGWARGGTTMIAEGSLQPGNSFVATKQNLLVYGICMENRDNSSS